MKAILLSAAIALAILFTEAGGRTMTVENNCGFTIWPGLHTDSASPPKPDYVAGWQQDDHQTVPSEVSNNWGSGRIWGRPSCDFSKGVPGPTQCVSGGCDGGLQCDQNTGESVPPATVAEFTLNENANDNYDVPVVDGFEFPMQITNDKGCSYTTHSADLNVNCPDQLEGPGNGQGQLVGCNNACNPSFSAGDNSNPNCCTGSHNTATMCPASFKDSCADSYGFPYDETHAAIGPIANLTITDQRVAPDGFQRAAIVVNGGTPGPLIVGNKGDRFLINVTDNLTNHTMNMTTSIHWHGFFQKGTTWADGAAFVSQCPIASGHSFLYNFTGGNQSGTFWYHSHLSTQYCDGLRGPMVVYDPEDPLKQYYDVDNEYTVITLADWYHLAAHLLPRGAKPDSTLINGLSRFKSPSGDVSGELAVIKVAPGKRYRFRLVSMSCDPNYIFSIDSHNMTIIMADSISTKPHRVDSLEIFAGQRYSFVLEANQPIDNYWIRANPNTNNFTNGNNSAILRYEGAPVADPNVTEPPALVNMLCEQDLAPFTPMPVPGAPYPGGVDKPISLEISVEGNHFLVNGHTFVPPKVPVLLQILSGKYKPEELMPKGSIIPLPINKTIEINFLHKDTRGVPHPFHMHGHAFAVVQSAGQHKPNYENPMWRDTVSAGKVDDNVTIRFETNNPGPWFLHCHKDPHLETGLAVVLAEDIPGTTNDTVHPPDEWDELCDIYNELPDNEH